MPTLPPPSVLLCLDGIVHDSDLPVQAFARHLAQELSAGQIRPIIAGMRGYLEAKPDLMPVGIDLTDAEDGYQAVETLARAADLTPEQIAAARRASREDLAASAWAVDRTDGLDELLAQLGGDAAVAVLVEPGDPAAAAVLESVDLPGATVVDCIEPAIGDQRRLVIGTRWAGQLAEAHDARCDTALVDRFALGRGAPTFRSPDLTGLVGPVRGWLNGAAR